MSTRCNIHFVEDGDIVANIYRHSDGYPDGFHGVPAFMERFFTAVEEQCHGDNRFNCAEYLAVKFIVFNVAEIQRPHREMGKTPGPLDFLSLGVTNQDHGDIEFVYTVECDKLDAEGRPTVTWEAA